MVKEMTAEAWWNPRSFQVSAARSSSWFSRNLQKFPQSEQVSHQLPLPPQPKF